MRRRHRGKSLSGSSRPWPTQASRIFCLNQFDFCTTSGLFFDYSKCVGTRTLAVNSEVSKSTRGWRRPSIAPSLREVHGSIPVPTDAGFWRKLFAFAGPGYLVAVGYMDPGNWATDLAGGARYGYTLLSVILISNLMAILLQALAVRLGIASGRDLAQACRDSYSTPVTMALWIVCEIAIAACDLAEVIGAAIALNLLFGMPLIWGVCLTALDVLIVLFLQNRGFRYVEALVVALILMIAGCFAVELWLSRPV